MTVCAVVVWITVVGMQRRELTLRKEAFKQYLSHHKGGIGSITDLESSSLSRTMVTWLGRLIGIGSYKPIDEVCYSVDADLTGAHMEEVARFTDLRALSAKVGRLSPESVRHLETLKRLELVDLAYSNVNDAMLEAIGRIPNLTSLDLSHTTITDDGVDHLSQCHTLRSIGLCGVNVTDKVLIVPGGHRLS